MCLGDRVDYIIYIETFLDSFWTYIGLLSFQVARASLTEFSKTLVTRALSGADLRNPRISACIRLWGLPLVWSIELFPNNSLTDLGYAGIKMLPWFSNTTLFTSVSVETMMGVPNMFVLNTFPYLLLIGETEKEIRRLTGTICFITWILLLRQTYINKFH